MLPTYCANFVSLVTRSNKFRGMISKFYRKSVLTGRGYKPVAAIVWQGSRKLPQTGCKSDGLIDDMTLRGVPTRFVNRS